MRFPRLPLPMLLVATLLLSGCLDGPYDPRALPYRVEAHEYRFPILPVDLDGDGEDEYLEQRPFDPSSGILSYVLKRHSGKIIDQLNVIGKEAGPPLFLDVLSGPALEILVPYVRHDSLFITIFDQTGKKLKRGGLFLTTGTPRIDTEDGSVYPWDPQVGALLLEDVDGDDKKELIVVHMTRFAGLPRGVAVYSWPEGKKIGEKIVGAMTELRVLADLDHDGRKELITQGYAPNNGAVADAFSDDQSHAIIFELGDRVQVDTSWNTTGARTTTFYEDFDNDGRKSLWLVSTNSPNLARRTEIKEIRSNPWRQVPLKTINEPFSTPKLADVDHDGAKEFIFFKDPNEIHVVDPDGWHHSVHTFRGKFQSLSLLPDLNGDGWHEIGLTYPSKTLILTSDFSPLAVITGKSIGGTLCSFHAGVGRPTYCLVTTEEGSTAYELVPNRFWWLYRYGVPALWVLGLALGLGAVVAVRRQTNRNRLLERLCLAHETATRDGWLLLDPKGHIARVNAAARVWLDEGPPEALKAFFEELRRSLPSHITRILSLDGKRESLHVTAEPLMLRGEARPHWLLTLHQTDPYTTEEYRAWGLMAQRIAHDLKNPLTSILLTLQRLQLEYQRRNPGEAIVYDGYVQRITDRIEHLRQMTRNFMKFVDLDEPERRETQFEAFLTEQAERLKSRLPADISMELKLGGNLPPVRIDTEQVASVLENLVTNALNAMPDGGVITLTTYSAHALLLPDHDAPDDYVVLEVMDTGIGITTNAQKQIFEAGFSTNGSTGLGLALAKKIIEDHGGHIEVESEPGTGSSFTLYFPF